MNEREQQKPSEAHGGPVRNMDKFLERINDLLDKVEQGKVHVEININLPFGLKSGGTATPVVEA